MSEDELVARLRLRDPAALEHFHAVYRDRIRAVARRIVRDDWDAEEVVQDVLLTVHRKIDLFNGSSAFWSWCYRVTENAAKMKVRRYKRVPVPVEEDALHAIAAAHTPEDPNGRPDRLLACKQATEAINTFLDQADDTNREIYTLMDLDGLSKEEVADRLGLTIPALKARLHRIRFALRDHVMQAV